jgi:LmbE family N-acetylglucosaminyl deacetylase
VLHDFRDGFLPYSGPAVKESVEATKDFHPDLIFTHQRHDLHQDHRLISELTWNTFRDHLILEYEIPKYDGDLGVPNVYVALDEATCRRKVEVLIRHFGSQRSKHWFTEDLFFALMRLRGMESGSASPYAEAFYGRKLIL